MTYNEFKLNCVLYLKSFEDKQFNELLHSSRIGWIHNFSLCNISFNKINGYCFVCDDIISKRHMIINFDNILCLWDDKKNTFRQIENVELIDII